MDTKYTSAQVDVSEKGIVAIASTSTEDRHGEIVDVEGWDLKNFKKNPVLQWAHDHTQPPIGVAKKVWIEGTGKKAKLMFEPVFHEVTEQARAIKRLFEEKILRTFSVGFRPLESDGDKFLKQELLEISAVNVPANADAMMMAYKSLKGEVGEEAMQSIGIPVTFIEKMGSMEQKLTIMSGQLETAVKGLQHLAPHPGRDRRLVTDRLAIAKAIARATDSLLGETQMPQAKRVRMVKAVKLASERLIKSHKEELNGKNQRTPIKGKANTS